MPLSEEQIERYSRQIILPEIGGIGQERLLAARVRLAGDRGAVSWAERYLCAAGVGRAGTDREADVGVALNAPDAVEAWWAAGVPAIDARIGDAGGSLTVLWATRPESACPRCAGAHPESSTRAEVPSGARPSPFDKAQGERGSGRADVARAGAVSFLAALSATEALKLILRVGVPLVGRRLRYDALAQTVHEEPVSCRAGCTVPRPRGRA